MEQEHLTVIPRLKPFIGKEELTALFLSMPDAVEIFEKVFAQEFGQQYALAFSYGRTAIWAFLKALEIEHAEIIQPAYTCSVVAHATVLSGNNPVFVDCSLDDYNMDLESIERAISDKTRVVIPTHLFGYPMDTNQINETVRSAEKKYGHKIWILQDCAHSFDARFEGQSVISSGDGAVFGLNISKQITSIFGGMFTTDTPEIAEKMTAFKKGTFGDPALLKRFRRTAYLLAVYPAFSSSFYGLVYWLQEKTPFLKNITDAYHLDEKVHFPPDYNEKLSPVEARVGIAQVKKYREIERRRKSIAQKYLDSLSSSPGFVLPPAVEGATFSHFPIRTENRAEFMHAFAREGIQVGQLIEYSMPHHPAYTSFAKNNTFPNALLCSQSMINLPIHPGLTDDDINKIIDVTKMVSANLL